mmetsp:Transcript_3095/g.4763  ORF Transcript_3095/g.4763 Transcript_3095/m.4763 type:complete len:103 (+) Transcript_3095:954-1262(+)
MMGIEGKVRRHHQRGEAIEKMEETGLGIENGKAVVDTGPEKGAWEGAEKGAESEAGGVVIGLGRMIERENIEGIENTADQEIETAGAEIIGVGEEGMIEDEK